MVVEKLRLSGLFESDREAVFLVPGTMAIALCARQGCRSVSAAQAIRLFDGMGRMERAQVRTFVAQQRLCSLPLCNTDDEKLACLVRGCIRTGRLVGIQQDEAGVQSSGETGARRKLVRMIEGQTRGRLVLAGRTYKLVVDVDLAKVPNRDDYEVVDRKGAGEILARIAAQQPTAAALLQQAGEALTKDWRPPASHPDGIILLRRMPVQASIGVKQAEALTPSQIAKLIAAEESVTLEVLVLGLDDEPLDGLSYVIETPDGESFDGDLGPSGKTKVTSAKKGTAGVTLKWAESEPSA
jgi:hypothetical protein